MDYVPCAGYIEANGKRYGKPNMAALPPDLARRIGPYIRHMPPPDQGRIDRECAEINERIRRAKENGTF